jgi:nucleoside phosphorylase
LIGVFLPTQIEYDAMDRDRLRELGAVPVLSGIGKINTVYTLAANVLRFQAFILCGFAGGYKKLTPGQTVQPFDVLQGDYDSEGMDDGADVITKNTGIHLPQTDFAHFICQDRMIKSQSLINPPDEKAVAVDMETYAFIAFMRKAGIERHCTIRVISDDCGANAKEQFLSSGKALAGKLRTAAETAVERVKVFL